MPVNLNGRHLLTLLDYTPEEIDYLLKLSADFKRLKRTRTPHRVLEGRNIALIFEKPSTRTRAAFIVAASDLGMHAEYLGKNDIQLGKKETVKDTARVLGRMFDGIEFRGFEQSTVEELARWAGVPVWNGLTDMYHPTQVLADLLTIREEFGTLRGLTLAYVGDGRNNMAHSLMIGGAKMGMNVRIVAPENLFPVQKVKDRTMEVARDTGARLEMVSDPATGVKDAHVIYTDVWVSMGEESQWEERLRLLMPYQVNSALMQATGRDDTIFLHCLPAFHNADTNMSKDTGALEVTEEVFEGPRSRVFDEAENRVHTIKAVMAATMGGV